MVVKTIAYENVDSVIDTLREAFREYPVMRYVIGEGAPDFERQHAALIRLFVMARVLCREPLLGIGATEKLHAAAVVSLPDTIGVPDELVALRKTIWSQVDAGARARYEAFCEACNQFEIDEPHHHLNMIGVRKAHRGRGHGRQLVDHVVQLSEADVGSAGVSLSTENEANVPFYEHLGFRMIGHAKVGPGLETWNFYRENS